VSIESGLSINEASGGESTRKAHSIQAQADSAPRFGPFRPSRHGGRVVPKEAEFVTAGCSSEVGHKYKAGLPLRRAASTAMAGYASLQGIRKIAGCPCGFCGCLREQKRVSRNPSATPARDGAPSLGMFDISCSQW